MYKDVCIHNAWYKDAKKLTYKVNKAIGSIVCQVYIILHLSPEQYNISSKFLAISPRSLISLRILEV